MSDFDAAPLRARMRIAVAQAREGTNRGLRLGAEHLLGSSRAVVPTEEGTLENSGKVSTDPASYTAAVSFDTVYAVRQHEELTWKHDPGRHAKYLEQPMHDEADTIGKLVAAEVRSEMGL